MISKFRVQDKVRLTARCPEYIDLTRSHPRTIIKIRYDTVKQCNWYLLGSNARGATAGDGDPRWGYWRYWFRSYQLVPYEPRPYHFKQPSKSGVETPLKPKLARRGSTGLVSPIKAIVKSTGD